MKFFDKYKKYIKGFFVKKLKRKYSKKRHIKIELKALQQK